MSPSTAAFGTMQLGQITTVDMTKFFSNAQGKVASKYALNLYALLNAMFESPCNLTG